MSKLIFPDRFSSMVYEAKPVVVVPDFFTVEECLRLRNTLHKNCEAAQSDYTEGKKVSWYDAVDADKESALLLRTLNAVRKANRQNFKFDPRVFLAQTAYVNRYQGATRDIRDWHTDLGGGSAEYRLRKLTGVVQLSAFDEYEGGELVFDHYHALAADAQKIALQQGSLIIFPAYEWHQINEVTSGDRYSFTLFVSGRPFA